MADQVTQRLEEANKMIFVRRYNDAAKLLDKLIASDEGKDNLMVHLRRIELGIKLQDLPDLKRRYQKLSNKAESNVIGEIGLLLVEQHGEMIAPEEAIARFQAILKADRSSAVAYYGIAFSLEMQGNIERAIYNYEQSVSLDQDWYPSYFGLSQLHYQKGDSEGGDQYFFLFEKSAPYNVYGNFDTHRKLYNEFLEAEKYADAETAIITLSEWWIENKGLCPDEIQVHEHLAVAKAAQLSGDNHKAQSRRTSALSMADDLLENDPPVKEGVVYFVARVLEEYGEFEASLRFYKKALRMSGGNPATIQKIGSQFLSMGEYELARDLFEDAFSVFPDNPEIRFCILVSKLKIAEVNVEEYLIGKERLKQLTTTNSDRVEILALLHSLQAKFQEDPEVHQHMGEIYLRMGNTERAGRHFKSMYELDGKSRTSSLRFVSYLMQYGDADEAKEILNEVSKSSDLTAEDEAEVNWLKANYHLRRAELTNAQEYLVKILKSDPWNVSYLVQYGICQMHSAPIDEELRKPDRNLKMLSDVDESSLEWNEFDQLTALFEEEMIMDVAYTRSKIRYLYSDGDEVLLQKLVHTACKHDPQQGTYDFLRLINTNFDSPLVYWALGVLYKELWQLEVASMWFEQCLLHPRVDKAIKSKCYLEIADSKVWLGKDLSKAIEYAKLSMDLTQKVERQMFTVLSHAYLKTGQVKQAQTFMSQGRGSDSIESTYLNGLLEYRNGARKKANEIWKPLLTVKSDNMRIHYIKQEILRFYFDGEPYLKVN